MFIVIDDPAGDDSKTPKELLRVSRAFRRMFPVTIAEKTVYWFINGRRYPEIPQHIKCRCVLTSIRLHQEDRL